MPFSVSIISTENQKLEYVWETTAGVINEGLATPSITIDSAGLESIVVKVTVEIKGLSKGCENKFHAEVFVDPKPRVIDYNEILGPQTNNQIKAHVDFLYAWLREAPTKIAIVFIYGSDKEFIARQAQFIKAIKSRKFDLERIKFVRKESELGIRMHFDLDSAEETPKPY